MFNLKDFLRRYWWLLILAILVIGSYGAHKVLRYEAAGDVMSLGQFISILFSFLTQPMFQLYILLVTALSSFFMIRGIIKLSPIDIARSSSAHLDYNLEAGKNFANQKADTVAGFVLLMVSILVQVFSISQPLRWIDLDGLGIVQWLFTIGIFGITWWKAESLRRRLTAKYQTQLEALQQR